MSDGQFSSKPIRSVRRGDFSARALGEFSAEATNSPDAARAFLASPAVQRAVNAVMEQPFPDVNEVKCAPFPKTTPVAAMDLGRPIASAVLVQEYLIGLLFLRICGWLFLLVGVLMLLGWAIMTAVTFFDEVQRLGLDGKYIGGVICSGLLGLGVTGAGAWFGIFRGRVVTQMCWFCPRGMVWRTESVFEWYGWEEVPELYCTLRASRPAVGIRFDRDIAWVSFGNTQASRLIVDYIENRASAAWMPDSLQAIAEGRPLRLGDWRLRRSSIQGPRTEVDWKNVFEVERNERDLVIHYWARREMTVPLDEIPFPSLFTALTRALYAHAREHP
jgi:hypothetical protein